MSDIPEEEKPLLVFYTEFEDMKRDRDMWRETAEAYKFSRDMLAEELSRLKATTKDG